MQQFHGFSTKKHEIVRAIQEVTNFLDSPILLLPFCIAGMVPTLGIDFNQPSSNLADLLDFLSYQCYYLSMNKIAVRGRKILSMVFRGISVSAASLILQACYGIMPAPAYGMPPSEEIKGTVVSKETGAPISGIKVSLKGTYGTYDVTDGDGKFYFSVRVQNAYELEFEDVDGASNGGLFQKQTQTLTQANNSLLIRMDLDI